MSMSDEYVKGWQDAVVSIRASLENYPNTGGDIGVMCEVERIVKEAEKKAIAKWYAEGQR